MIAYLENGKWIDTDKLERIPFEGCGFGHAYFSTPSGNIIDATPFIIPGNDHEYYIIEEGMELHEKLKKHLNPNPEDEL